MAHKVVVVGASLGGLRALQALLSALPGDFTLPVAIVQHRHSQTDETLCALLEKKSTLPVSEPEDKEALNAGQVYIAPADYHLLVADGLFNLSTEAHVLHARPSIDVLFESAADAYGKGTIGVILTGTGQDGAQGLAYVKEHGGLALVQRPDDAENGLLPEAAIRATEVDRILPLSEIAPYLVQLAKAGGK